MNNNYKNNTRISIKNDKLQMMSNVFILRKKKKKKITKIIRKLFLRFIIIYFARIVSNILSNLCFPSSLGQLFRIYTLYTSPDLSIESIFLTQYKLIDTFLHKIILFYICILLTIK